MLSRRAPGDLDATAAWLDRLLAEHPQHAARYARTRITQAAYFLAWLDQQHLPLADVTQGHVDAWVAAGASTRHRLRDFLTWTHARRLTPRLEVAWLGTRGAPTYTTGGNADSDGAGPNGTGEQAYLRLSQQPVLLPPRLAMLVDQLARQARPRPDGPAWLFPGRASSVHPLGAGRLTLLLNRHLGLSVRAGRGGVLCDLTADLPAPVVAHLLGMNITTVTRWGEAAKHNWAAYIADRAADATSAAPAAATADKVYATDL